MAHVDNPFVAAVEAAEEVEELSWDELFGSQLYESGPPMPLGLAQPPATQLPRCGGTANRVNVVSLHGGSGATTVARFIGDDLAHECGQAVPSSGSVLFVARTNGVGLDRLEDAARCWAAGEYEGVNVLGVVLVAALPKLPKELSGAAKAGSRMLPRAWHLEWKNEWHACAEAPLTGLDLRARRTRKALRAECEKWLRTGVA